MGLLPPIYLASGIEFKVRIEDAGGSLLYAADGIQNSGGGGGGAAPVDAYTKAQSDASFVNVDGDVMTGNLTIDKASPTLALNKPAAGTNSALLGQTAGKARWLVTLGDGTAEGGANAGSDFGIHGYTDAGAFLSTPLFISRATGAVTVNSFLSVTGELKCASTLRLSADNTKYLHWDGTNYHLGGSGTIYTTGNFNSAAYAPVGGVSGNWIVGSSTHGADGNIYMPWAGDWLSNVLGGKAALAGATFGGGVTFSAGATFNGLTVFASNTQVPGAPTTGVAANCHIANAENNRFYRNTSSLAYKTAVEALAPEYGDKILALKPIFYRGNEKSADDPTWSWFGFSAENCDEVDFRFCSYTVAEADKGEGWQKKPLTPDNVHTHGILAALVELVQRQEARIRALEGAGQ